MDILDKITSALLMSRADLNYVVDAFLADPESVETAIEAWMRVKNMLIGYVTWPTLKELFDDPQHWPDIRDQLGQEMDTMIYPFSEKKGTRFRMFRDTDSGKYENRSIGSDLFAGSRAC